jgi:hypothetical protein
VIPGAGHRAKTRRERSLPGQNSGKLREVGTNRRILGQTIVVSRLTVAPANSAVRGARGVIHVRRLVFHSPLRFCGCSCGLLWRATGTGLEAGCRSGAVALGVVPETVAPVSRSGRASFRLVRGSASGTLDSEHSGRYSAHRAEAPRRFVAIASASTTAKALGGPRAIARGALLVSEPLVSEYDGVDCVRDDLLHVPLSLRLGEADGRVRVKSANA